MSYVTENQPLGTPTWVDLGVPDVDRAIAFYRAVFGWTCEKGPEQYGGYTMCTIDGRPAAAIAPNDEPGATEFWWNVYLATDDVDATAAAARAAGGTVLAEPFDVMDQGRMAIVIDPVGAQFGLWQGRAMIGAQVVNEPGAVVRNDLTTATPEPARAFYREVFGFTLDRNDDLPGYDFTFLRRPDGHEVAGIFGDPSVAKSRWTTTFEVADTDAVVASARAGGGTSTDPEDFVYGRMATITDPFGAEFSVIARP